jgi:hypothetical protein
MSVPPKWRERLASVRENMPPVVGKDGNPASALDRGRVESAFAHSTVPVEHLGYVKGVRQTRAAQVAEARYSIGNREIEVPTPAGGSFKRDTPMGRVMFAGSLVHETGHAVDHNLNPVQFGMRRGQGAKAGLGRMEAVAENYALRHTAEWGNESYHSAYDHAVLTHEASKARGGQGSPVIQSAFGKQGTATYKDFRKLGLTPDDPVPDEGEVGRRLDQDWQPSLHPKWEDPRASANRVDQARQTRQSKKPLIG